MKTLSLLIVLLLALTPVHSAPTSIAMSYCGFSEQFCGDSNTDDVYSLSNSVLLSYALIGTNGAVIVEKETYPGDLVTTWKKTGKRVVLSIGGPYSDWTNVYSSDANRQAFLTTALNAVRTYGLDGVNIDIEGSYFATPKQVANLIIDLRKTLNTIGRKYITLTSDCIAIYQGVAVPDPDVGGNPFNYMVPIIQLADTSIDYYQTKAYSNWYDGYDHTSLDYLQDVYLNWRNLQGYCKGCKPIANFKGVAPAKLLIGVVGSADARKAPQYAGPQIIRDFKAWLMSKGYDMVGFNIWNSRWDSLNGNQISIAVAG